MRRALLPVLAVTGVVVGHTLTYALLHETTHAYWQAAVTVALLAGALATGSHVTQAVRRTPLTLTRVGVRLAAMQMVMFTMMEASERIAVDQPLTALFDHRILVIGLVMQALVAGALVQVLRLLGRAAVAVADAIGARWSPAITPELARSWTEQVVPVGAIVGRPCGSRAPPLAA